MAADGRTEWTNAQLEQLFKPSMGGMEAFMRAFEPFAKTAMLGNLELMRLMSRRGQAWLDAPKAFAACRTPQEIAAAQVRFWQTCAQDYTETSRRVAETWTTTIARAGAEVARDDAPPRDFITFPEPKQATPRANDRRAA